MSDYPQINARISAAEKAWVKAYEKATGRKGTELVQGMLAALIKRCGANQHPRYPFDFEVNCRTETIQLALAAEEPATYHATKSPAAQTPRKAPRSGAA